MGKSSHSTSESVGHDAILRLSTRTKWIANYQSAVDSMDEMRDRTIALELFRDNVVAALIECRDYDQLYTRIMSSLDELDIGLAEHVVSRHVEYLVRLNNVTGDNT